MGIKKTQFIIFIFIIFLIGCSKSQKVYYENGTLKSEYFVNSSGRKDGKEIIYYPTGEILSISNFKDGDWIDSIVKYKKNGKLLSILKRYNDSIYIKNYAGDLISSKGRVDSLLRPISWWNYYKNGEIIREVERMVIKNKSIVNRKKIYVHGVLDSSRSDLFYLKKPSSMKAGRQYPIEVDFSFCKDSSTNLLGKNYYYLLISPEINEDFSNINNVSLDTLIPKKDCKFIFNLEFRKNGVKNFKAIIEKHSMSYENDNLFINKRKLFIKDILIVE